MFFLPVCLFTMHVPDALGGKKWLIPLELELKMVVKHHVGAENWPRPSAGATSALTCAPSLQPTKEGHLSKVFFVSGFFLGGGLRYR